jgi:hypothetical protein
LSSPAEFLAKWNEPGASLPDLTLRYARALDDATPARAAYRNCAMRMSEAAYPMLDAFEDQFGDHDGFREVMAELSGGIRKGKASAEASPPDRQIFATPKGRRVVFVLRGSGWRIDAFDELRVQMGMRASLSGYSFMEADFEAAVIQRANQIESKLPLYQDAMEKVAKRIRDGEFADVEAAMKAVGDASKALKAD